MKIEKGKKLTAQKVVIYGVEGIGKSTFASQFPDPLFSDTEGGTNALDVSRFESPADWYELVEQAEYVRTHRVCKTYVVDSIDWAERMCMDAICKDAGKKSIEDFGYGKGYTVLLEWVQKYLDILQQIVDNGVNVVLTAHSQVKKIERPDDVNAYDRYELKLQKKTCPVIKEWADMLLFANFETYTQKDKDGKVSAKGKNRMMYTTYNPVWDAKNRHGLPDELPFSFDSIKDCIPVFDDSEIKAKAKANTSEIINKMTEEEHEDFTEIKSKADALREELQKRNILEQSVIFLLNNKGLITGKNSLDDFTEEEIENTIGLLDKICEIIEDEDLPF